MSLQFNRIACIEVAISSKSSTKWDFKSFLHLKNKATKYKNSALRPITVF